MSGLSVAEVLDRAADLIEPEGRWTQGAEARDQGGNPVMAFSDEAQCFCLIGAVRRVGGYPIIERVRSAMRGIIRGKPWEWNDRAVRTQAEVIAKLREAAALAREQGK